MCFQKKKNRFENVSKVNYEHALELMQPTLLAMKRKILNECISLIKKYKICKKAFW